MTPEFKTLCEAFEALAAKLDARLTRMEARMGIVEDADTAPGHPELPLAEALPVEDPTLRDLPMPDHFKLPPLPEGKTRWVNRGDFRNEKPQAAGGRDVRYFSEIDDAWVQALTFSGPFPHIEAIAEPVNVKPRMIPEPGGYYFTRNDQTARILRKDAETFFGEIYSSGQEKWFPFHWSISGRPYNNDPGFDIVSTTPF